MHLLKILYYTFRSLFNYRYPYVVMRWQALDTNPTIAFRGLTVGVTGPKVSTRDRAALRWLGVTADCLDYCEYLKEWWASESQRVSFRVDIPVDYVEGRL